jgi:hypothetical protein
MKKTNIKIVNEQKQTYTQALGDRFVSPKPLPPDWAEGEWINASPPNKTVKFYIDDIFTRYKIPWFPEMSIDEAAIDAKYQKKIESDRTKKKNNKLSNADFIKLARRHSRNAEAEKKKAIKSRIRKTKIIALDQTMSVEDVATINSWIKITNNIKDLESIRISFEGKSVSPIELVKKGILPLSFYPSKKAKNKEDEKEKEQVKPDRPDLAVDKKKEQVIIQKEMQEAEKELQTGLEMAITGLSGGGNTKVKLPCDQNFKNMDNKTIIDTLEASLMYAAGANLGIAAITATGGTLKTLGLQSRIEQYSREIFKADKKEAADLIKKRGVAARWVSIISGLAGLGFKAVTAPARVKTTALVGGAAAGAGTYAATDGDYAAALGSGFTVAAFFVTRPLKMLRASQPAQSAARAAGFAGLAKVVNYVEETLGTATNVSDLRCITKRLMIGAILGGTAAGSFGLLKIISRPAVQASLKSAFKSGRYSQAIDESLKPVLITFKEETGTNVLESIVAPMKNEVIKLFDDVEVFQALYVNQKIALINWIRKLNKNAQNKNISTEIDRLYDPNEALMKELAEILPNEAERKIFLSKTVTVLNDGAKKVYDDLVTFTQKKLEDVLVKIKSDLKDAEKLAKIANEAKTGGRAVKQVEKLFIDKIVPLAENINKIHWTNIQKSISKSAKIEKDLISDLDKALKNIPDINIKSGIDLPSQALKDRIIKITESYIERQVLTGETVASGEVIVSLKNATKETFSGKAGLDNVLRALDKLEPTIIKRIDDLTKQADNIRSSAIQSDLNNLAILESVGNLAKEQSTLKGIIEKNYDKLKNSLSESVYEKLDRVTGLKRTASPKHIPASNRHKRSVDKSVDKMTDKELRRAALPGVTRRAAGALGKPAVATAKGAMASGVGTSKIASSVMRVGISRTLLETALLRQAAAGAGVLALGYPVLSEVGKGDLEAFWSDDSEALNVKRFLTQIYFNILMNKVSQNAEDIGSNINDKDRNNRKNKNIFQFFPNFNRETFVSVSEFYLFFKKETMRQSKVFKNQMQLPSFAKESDFGSILQDYIRPIVFQIIMSENDLFSKTKSLTRSAETDKRLSLNAITRALLSDSEKDRRKNIMGLIKKARLNIIGKIKEQKEDRGGTDLTFNEPEDVVDIDFDPDDPEFMAVAAPERLELKKIGDAAYKKALSDETGKNLKGEELKKYALKKAEDAQRAYAAYNLDKPEIRGAYEVFAPGQLDLVIQNKKFTLDPKSSKKNINLITKYVQNTKFKDLPNLPGPLKSKDFILKLIKAESNWNPRAVSSAKAWGLGQFKAFARQDLADKRDPDFDAFNAMKSINGIPQYLGLVQNYITEKNKKNKYAKAMWDVASDDEKARIILYAYQQGVGGGWGEIANKIGASVVAGAILPTDHRAMLDTYFQNRTKFYEKYRSKKNPKKDPDYVNKIIGPPTPGRLVPKQIAAPRGMPTGVKEMKKVDLEKLVLEVIKEAASDRYSSYPYGSNVKGEEEPKEDYMEEWKAFSDVIVRDGSRKTAIEVAKVLINDLELFKDVLEVLEDKQSIGSAIMEKTKEAKEKRKNV